MKTIAIIEDDPSQKFVLRNLVEEMGYSVVAEASTGTEAVRACLEVKPELVLMDVEIPEMDGIEAAKEINRTSPTPVVLVTASEDEGLVIRAVSAGIMSFVPKPVKLNELHVAMELASARFSELQLLREENSGLKEQVAARKFIDKAKGILMEKERLTEDEAFTKIRGLSMGQRKSMKEIAEMIILVMGKGGDGGK